MAAGRDEHGVHGEEGTSGSLKCLDLETGTVKWEQDVVVDRKMAYNHYFGKPAGKKKA